MAPPQTPPSAGKTILSFLEPINTKKGVDMEEKAEKINWQDAASMLNNRWNVARDEKFNNKDENLNTWLTQHGLLIMMCQQEPFGFPEIELPCFLGDSDSDHLTASWIGGGGDMMELISTNEITSFATNNLMNSKIGVALDPAKVDIKCSYP